MKRSKSMTLRLMVGTVGVAALAGCDGDPQVNGVAHKNLESCVSSGLHEIGECRAAFSEAEAAHLIGAPQYESKDLCEEEFGDDQCSTVRASNGGTSFIYIPHMGGYVMSKVPYKDASGAEKYRSSAQPFYQTAKGRSITASGYQMSGSSGAVALPQSVAVTKVKSGPVMTKTTVKSSGGFGARAGGKAGS